MPFISFPDVPNFPGVPSLTRTVSTALASNTTLSIAVGSVSNVLTSAYNSTPQWGIFDQDGNQLGLSDSSSSLLTAVASQLLGTTNTVLSTVGMEFARETRVADFPVEGGSFATYNKVQTPGTPVVVLALSGSEEDRAYFLSAIDDACNSTDLYNVVTPEATYVGYTIERYNYQRKSTQGATLLTVEVFLREVREVEAAYTVSSVAPITSPVSAASISPVDNGKAQTTAPTTSTLKSLKNALGL